MNPPIRLLTQSPFPLLWPATAALCPVLFGCAHPWRCRMERTSRRRDGLRYMQCGGVLFRPNRVITAAHCVNRPDGVVAGDFVEVGGLALQTGVTVRVRIGQAGRKGPWGVEEAGGDKAQGGQTHAGGRTQRWGGEGGRRPCLSASIACQTSTARRLTRAGCLCAWKIPYPRRCLASNPPPDGRSSHQPLPTLLRPPPPPYPL